MEPTFEEFCNTSPKESQPNLRQSWMVVFAMVSWPFSAQMRSSGRTTPSSRAAAARMTLNVEPGSKGSVTARLRQTSREDTARNALGLNVGRRELAPQPDEGLAGGELRVQLALRRVEDRRQPRGDAHGIAQRARLGEE